jgi:hypothetical protein
MALYDLVAAVTATLGTADVVVGAAVSGYKNWAGVPNGASVSYGIRERVSATGPVLQSEVGTGTWTAGTNTLTRTSVEASTNGGAKIVLATGYAEVYITPILVDWNDKVDIGGTPVSGQVGYWSSASELVGSSSFTWNDATRVLGIAPSSIQADLGGSNFTIRGGDDFSVGQGGNVRLVGGNETSGSGFGGSVYLAPGNGGIRAGDISLIAPDVDKPGQIIIQSASAQAGNNGGGLVSIVAGGANSSGSGNGGQLSFESGDGGVNGDGGDITFSLGRKGAGGVENGRLRFSLLGGVYLQFDLTNIATSDKNYMMPNVSGTLAIGAGTLTASTTNDVTVAAHTHAITGSPTLLGNGAMQYQTIVTGATPFAPAYSGFLLDGNAGGKTIFNVTNTKILTFNVTDVSSITFTGACNITIPTAGSVTAALLGTANTFTALNTFSAHIGIAENIYIGYPGVPGASYMATESAGYNSVMNTLYSFYLNLDSGAAGTNQGFELGKGRAGISSGTRLFRFGTDGNVALYLENSFFGYPGSTAQGFTPFTSSYNFLYNSLFNHVWNIDSGNTSTTQKFIWGHNGTSETPTEIASLTEAGVFTVPSVVVNEAGDAAGDLRAESDTEANMLFLDANGDTDGALYLGGTTNGLKIVKGGDLTLLGTAKYERHVQLAAYVNGNPADSPDQDDVFTAGALIYVTTGDHNAHCQWEIPDDWDGTDIIFEVDWFPTSGAMSGTDTLKWDVEYRSIAAGELINAGTSETVSNTDSADYSRYQTKHSQFVLTYNNANQPLAAQDHIYFKVGRDTGVANDFGGSVGVTAFEILYQSKGFPTN